MKKQALTFKVDGGLKKVSELYESADHHCTEKYYADPSSLLAHFAEAPSQEIRLSPGYKKLAQSLEKLDFEKLYGTLETQGRNCYETVQEKTFTTLWQSVTGHEPSYDMASSKTPSMGFSFSFSVSVSVSVSVVAVAVAVASLSGHHEEEKQTPTRRPTVPGGPKFAQKFASDAELRYIAHHAQTVVDHLNWFS